VTHISNISSPNARWRPSTPIAVSAITAVRYASTTPTTPTPPAPTSATPTPVASTSAAPTPAPETATSFPNLDTINLDNLDLSNASDIAKIPEGIGYLHEIGINYGWGVTSSIQWLIEHFHIYGGLPWWGSIAATAITLRLLIFRFYLKASDVNARQSALVSVTKPITTRMTEMQREGNSQGVMAAYQQLRAVRARAGISFRDQFAPVILQGVLGYCGFRLISAMAALPVPGLVDGGFLWLKDLTATDPYLIMPTLMAASVWGLVRMGGETGSMNSELASANMKFTMNYLMPGLIFLIMGWQSGALCVWFAASGAIGIAQAFLLRNETVRRFFGIAPLYKPTKEENDGGPMQAWMEGMRSVAPTTSSGTTGASGGTGKNAAFMRPAYQAPNLHRNGSGRSQSNVIDVKGTSTSSTEEMVSPSLPPRTDGIAGMIKNGKEWWGGIREGYRQRMIIAKEKQERLAKKAEADRYESRARARGR